MKEEIPGKRRKVERNNNGRTIKDAPVIIYMVYESQSCRSNMPFNTKAEVTSTGAFAMPYANFLASSRN